jgi:hypothetical protein
VGGPTGSRPTPGRASRSDPRRAKPLRGFEPRTYALRKHRSTAELKWRFHPDSPTLGRFRVVFLGREVVDVPTSVPDLDNGRIVGGPPLEVKPSKPHAVEKCSRVHAQSGGDHADFQDRAVSVSAFNPADVRPVQPAAVSEAFLREFHAKTLAANIVAENLQRFLLFGPHPGIGVRFPVNVCRLFCTVPNSPQSAEL